MFELRLIVAKLKTEAHRLDAVVHQMSGSISGDLALAREMVGSLPTIATIDAVLPGKSGKGLADDETALRQALAAPQPDYAAIRAAFEKVRDALPAYRRILAVADLMEDTATMAARGGDKGLLDRAGKGVDGVRDAIEKRIRDGDFDAAVQSLAAVHNDLLTQAQDHARQARAKNRTVGAEQAAPPTQSPIDDLASERDNEGKHMRALGDSGEQPPISFFEREGEVPPTSLMHPVTGSVNAAKAVQLSAADLLARAAQKRKDPAVPALPSTEVERLSALATPARASKFVTALDGASFVCAQPFDDPRRDFIRCALATVKVEDRPRLLASLSAGRRPTVEKIFASLTPDRVPKARADLIDTIKRDRKLGEDFRELDQLFKARDKSFETVLNELGYGPLLDQWTPPKVTRLEAVFAHPGFSGKTLRDIAVKLKQGDKASLVRLIGQSDLTATTRARLVAELLDGDFFWSLDDDLSAALVTGMDDEETAIFFDELYRRGKLEQFLSPHSFWRLLLRSSPSAFCAYSPMTTKRRWPSLPSTASTWKSSLRIATNAGWVDRQTARAAQIVDQAAIDALPVDPVVKNSTKVFLSIIGHVKYRDSASCRTTPIARCRRRPKA